MNDYLKKLILESGKVLLITHINADGDALGSICAMREILNELNIECDLCFDGSVNERYISLFDESVFKKSAELERSYELAISLDCADKYRIGSSHESFFASKKTVNIDHHITNDNFADINIVRDSSSTGEILFDMAHEMGFRINDRAARYLYISIASDTGNFCYSNTKPSTFICAGGLISQFNHSEVARQLFNTRSYENTVLLATAIKNIELHANGKIGYVYLSQSDLKVMNGKIPDYDQVIAFAMDIDSVDVCFFMREQLSGGYKGSLRSKREIDVAAVASQFGGGGHRNAAGFSINMDYETSKRNVLDELIKIVS